MRLLTVGKYKGEELVLRSSFSVCTGNFLDVGFNFGAQWLIGVSNTSPNYSTCGSLIGSTEGLKWLNTISGTVRLLCVGVGAQLVN